MTSGTIDTRAFAGWAWTGMLLHRQTWGKVDAICIEGAVPHGRSKLGKELEEVQATLRTIFPRALWIDAVRWKRFKTRKLPKLGKGETRTRHERDAIRIGQWYLEHYLANSA